MKRIPRPSPAAAIALIALMAALSPSAYGAARHLIGTKQLRKGAVTTSKLRNGAVTSAKIAPGVIPAAPDLTGFASKGDSYTKAEADARFTPPKGLARTFFVPADGTAQQNGDRLAAAVASLPKDNGAAALVLDPGYFDVGGRTLEIPSSTTVRGAGRWKTMVRGSGTPFHVAAGGVGVRLEDLAVFSTGVIACGVDGEATIDAVDMRPNNASANVHTIDASSGSLHASDCTVAADAAVAMPIFAKSLRLDRCRLTAKGTQLADGLVLNTNGDAEILRSVIETTGVNQAGARGIDLGPNSKAAVDDTTVRNNGHGAAVYAATGTDATIRNSEIRGLEYSLAFMGNAQARVAYTQLQGTKLGSAFHCIGLYDQNNEPLVCS
jgi:hypothetical protein